MPLGSSSGWFERDAMSEGAGCGPPQRVAATRTTRVQNVAEGQARRSRVTLCTPCVLNVTESPRAWLSVTFCTLCAYPLHSGCVPVARSGRLAAREGMRRFLTTLCWPRYAYRTKSSTAVRSRRAHRCADRRVEPARHAADPTQPALTGHAPHPGAAARFARREPPPRPHIPQADSLPRPLKNSSCTIGVIGTCPAQRDGGPRRHREIP